MTDTLRHSYKVHEWATGASRAGRHTRRDGEAMYTPCLTQQDTATLLPSCFRHVLQSIPGVYRRPKPMLSQVSTIPALRGRLKTLRWQSHQVPVKRR